MLFAGGRNQARKEGDRLKCPSFFLGASGAGGSQLVRPGDLPRHSENKGPRSKEQKGLEKPEGLGQRVASLFPGGILRMPHIQMPKCLDHPTGTRFPRAGPESPPGLRQAPLHRHLLPGAFGVLGMELHRTDLQLSPPLFHPSGLAAGCRTHDTYRPAFTSQSRIHWIRCGE